MALALAAVTMVAACGGGAAPEVDVVLEERLGGDATRTALTNNAFGLPVSNLTSEQRRLFEVGDSFFSQNWVSAPASTTGRDGLGPTFNAQACASCHVFDGRGIPPEGPDDTASLGLLLRLAIPAGDGVQAPDPAYGGQLQDRAVHDVAAEGQISITWVTESGTYDDGTPYELRRPEIELVDLAFGPLDPATTVSPRLAPPVFGVGLLEAVPAADIEALADPDDADGDGISGRVNRVVDPRTGDDALGRFGWKANVATIEAQVAGAFAGDIGITSSLHPDENCPPGQDACATALGGGSPEIDDDLLARVVFYNRTLAVPGMRDVETDSVQAGARQFTELGCVACHTPTLQTGPDDVADLADQTIHPYTDLLLHDMGEGLADGSPDGLASGSEWRTPPLWGIGLVDSINSGRFLLHDGRARTLEEAILWHGGEGQASADAFRSLDADDRAALVAFLEAL